jgi:ribonucleotide reductase beta subunit family protein with ferritin-like domain
VSYFNTCPSILHTLMQPEGQKQLFYLWSQEKRVTRRLECVLSVYQLFFSVSCIFPLWRNLKKETACSKIATSRNPPTSFSKSRTQNVVLLRRARSAVLYNFPTQKQVITQNIQACIYFTVTLYTQLLCPNLFRTAHNLRLFWDLK